ncbi:carboxymuconolactone decarboxylase family protein [Pseudorhodoferax sp.]|uniref:carboxymuconolactone decarboxylase family protein n=1 Tax=Pseudorhodoferax sp. TaxID=1993553 RepID=UPI0039E40827
MQHDAARDPAHFGQAFDDPAVPRWLEQAAPTALAAASRYWRTIVGGGHLSPRMKELVLVALHGSVTALDSEALRRHIGRAIAAGASPQDVLDVLTSIVGVANHALYSAVPILLDALRDAGHPDAELPPATAQAEAAKADFIRTRGFWNEQRDALARLMPEYFGALSEVSMQPWKDGVLSARERELIYIAIDCGPTHGYGPGLALHIRHALGHGATRDEILEVFQLAALTGLEGFILGAQALAAFPLATGSTGT